MRAVFLQVCQRLIVVSYCMPGSPQCQVESAILYITSRAFSFSLGWPSIRLRPAILVLFDGAHEVVIHAHRVIGILKEDRTVASPSIAES